MSKGLGDVRLGSAFDGEVRRARKMGGLNLRGHWTATARNGQGQVLWTENWENLILNEGRDHALDVAISNGGQTATWYLALKGAGSIVAGDTAAQIGTGNAWSEVVAYDEAVRQTFTDAGVTAGSLDNSAAPSTFTISANATTVDGAFLISIATKGLTTGVVYAAGDFSTSKVLNDNDTLDVTATFTSADDGV